MRFPKPKTLIKDQYQNGQGHCAVGWIAKCIEDDTFQLEDERDVEILRKIQQDSLAYILQYCVEEYIFGGMFNQVISDNDNAKTATERIEKLHHHLKQNGHDWTDMQ